MFLTTTHRVTSPKWQNESFLPPSLQRTPILTVIQGQECPCGSPRVQWRSSSIILEGKKMMLDTLKRVRENSFTLPVLHTRTHPKAAQLSAKRDLLSPWFLPWEKVRVCEWALSFLSYVGCCQRDPLLSHPSRILSAAWLKWQGGGVGHRGRE